MLESPNVQDTFRPIPGLISCAGVTGSAGITHATQISRLSSSLSHTLIACGRAHHLRLSDLLCWWRETHCCFDSFKLPFLERGQTVTRVGKCVPCPPLKNPGEGWVYVHVHVCPYMTLYIPVGSPTMK